MNSPFIRTRFVVPILRAPLGLALVFAVGLPSLNAASPASSALPKSLASHPLLWAIDLGSHQYTIPRACDGRLYVGINDMQLDHPAVKSTGGGILMCLSQATGKRIWQLPIPRYMKGTNKPFHFNHWKCGVCSRPAIDGDRLYIVGPRGDVLCVDREGQANGNDGPFLDELQYMQVPAGSHYRLTKTDGDIVWRFDMIGHLGVVPHDVCGSSPVIYGDYLYVCTTNGVDDTHERVANPRAPSLIALDKQTGRLAAVDDARIGDRILHGQWSSPVVAEIGGQPLLFFGGGDGVLYAFHVLQRAAGKETVQALRPVWNYDCCPADYRQRDGHPIAYSRWNAKHGDGPSEIIATPTVYQDRVYVAIGQSPIHGPGRGMLSCVDGLTGSKIWATREVDRTLSNAVIHDGLLYIADYSGRLHCLEAATGQYVWQHGLGAGVWCASPAIVNEKVYISTEKQKLWVLTAGREKSVLSQCRVRSMAITPTVADGILYFSTQRRLFAIQLD